MTDFEKELAGYRARSKAFRASRKPIRDAAVREIKPRILEVLRLADESDAAYRKYGGSYDSWYSVGLMTAELRQTGRGWTGDAFHNLTKRDQCGVVRRAMEALRREKLINRAIGYFEGRECRQYQFGAEPC